MTTSTGSAFPMSIDDLLPRVRARAVELGRVPSRNQIMTEFKVGAPKARAVLAALDGAEVDPADRPEVSAGRRLHAVAAPALAPGSVESEQPTDNGDDPQPEALMSSVADPGTEITPTPAPEPVTTPASPDPTPPEGDVRAEESDLVPARSAARRVRSWRLTLVLLSLPAFVAIWGGWVGLGELTGFGPIHLLPGIADRFVINSAITLPIGVETYATFALRVWLSAGSRSPRARDFAKVSAFGALALGMVGQVAYHLMSAAGVTKAPWPVTTLVACLPVVVLGCGAALAHLLHTDDQEGQA